MNKSDLDILKSKFRRHKISYQINGYKIVIGKAKIDYTTLIGLIILPFLVLIGALLYLIFIDNSIFIKMPLKLILLMMSSLGVSIFYLQRLISNKNANNIIKTFYNESLKLESKNFVGHFDRRNINAIFYEISFLEDNMYEGTLYLIDNQENLYTLLGFDDEEEKYVINDLKWFTKYFSDYLGLNY